MEQSRLSEDAPRSDHDRPRPHVSVIVPVYNVQEYLADCLDSLLGQTLNSLEIIAVDDGSTDDSSRILAEYASAHPDRIRSFTKPNGGLSDARNFGIGRARGEYIGFVDSDDWVDAEMFEAMYERAIETDSEAVVCGARLHMYQDDVEVEDAARNIDLRGSISNFGNSVTQNPHILFSSHSYACTKLFHRRLFDEWGFEFPIGQWFEDSALIYNIMYAANRVSCLQDNFYHYRFNRSGAITTTLSPKIFDIFKSCDSILDFYRDKKIGHPRIDHVLEQLVRTHIIGRYQLFLENTDKGYQQPKLTWAEKRLSWAFVRRAFQYLDTEFPGWKARYKYKSAGAGVPVWWRARKSLPLMFVLIFVPQVGLSSFRRLLLKARKTQRKATKLFASPATRKQRKVAAGKEEAKLVKKRKGLQKHGFEVLDRLDASFQKAGVSYFADFGTLLGFVRDGGFMRHDLDLDIGAFADDDEKLDVYAALLDAGFVHYRTYLFEERVVEYSFHSLDEYGQKSVKFDINFYENVDGKSRCWLFHYLPDAGLPLRARFATEMNYSQIVGTEMLEVQGHAVPVPKDYERLLTEKYGPSWRTPDPSWVYWDSPAATPLEPLGRYVTHYQMPAHRIPDLQAEQLKVLEAFEHVCKEHGFRFYLAEGTLLGAVRHQGYIPWDDDIDVSMPRDDYERLLALPSDAWPTGYGMWNHVTDPNYHLPFSKVVARAHNGFRNTFPPTVEHQFSGPRMDIFPLDRVAHAHSPEQDAVAKQVRVLRNAMLVKAGYPGKKKTAAMPAGLEFIPMTVFQDWIRSLATLSNDDPEATYLVNWSSSYSHLKQTFAEDWYGEPSMVQFEGKPRPCPQKSERILTTIYGDYMKLPPEDERQNASHYMICDKWA